MNRISFIRIAVLVAAFVALVCGTTIASQRSATAMTRAANQFLSSLSVEQRAKAALPFAGEERLRWNFIPNEMFPRKGLMIKDMNEAQRRLAQDLLQTGFSARGYGKVTSIIELEDILKVIEGGRFARNKEEYYFAIFGTPGNTGAWGWRVDGHHLSAHFTIVDGAMKNAVASSPTFLGANPAEVRAGGKQGLRILAEEEDTARTLIEAMSPDQRKIAIIDATAPNEIVTTNKNDISPFPDEGVTYASLDAAQKTLLMKVIEAYTNTMETDIAAERLGALKNAGIENIRFAWAGAIERGKKHYYRVQGPTFLIEYDNSQNDGNHAHSVWRDFKGDFGRDLLREHLASTPH